MALRGAPGIRAQGQREPISRKQAPLSPAQRAQRLFQGSRGAHLAKVSMYGDQLRVGARVDYCRIRAA